MKNKKSKKFLVRRIIAIIIIVFIILSLRNLLYNFWQKEQTKQTRLLLDNEFIDISDNIYVEDSIIYISEEDIKNIFDNTIYYNVGDKELITTYNKHVAVMHLNENKILINDSTIQTQGQLKEIDSNIYLPISDLGIVYDIESEYSESTNIVIINSTNKKKSRVMVINDTKIKKSKSFLSTTLEKVKRGDYLYVLEDSGRYKKVRSSLGNIGYVKNKKISNEEILREDLHEKIAEINVLQEYSDINKTYENVKTDQNKENFVIIDDFEFNKDKTIISKIDVQLENYKRYLSWTEENNINIIGNLKNDLQVSSSLTTYTQRNKLINELYNKIMQNQYKGVCIDFEQIDDVNSFNRFLIELTPKFRESGLKVIVKLNNQLDKEKVKEIVDFTI